jgi:hypothetical protein
VYALREANGVLHPLAVASTMSASLS